MSTVPYILAAILTLLQGADWYTTARAIASGQGREGNPVMAWLFGKIGFTPTMAGKLVLVGAGSFYGAGPLGWQIMAAIIAFYVWIVWNNWTLVKS